MRPLDELKPCKATRCSPLMANARVRAAEQIRSVRDAGLLAFVACGAV
jgi:hypothetical protein